MGAYSPRGRSRHLLEKCNDFEKNGTGFYWHCDPDVSAPVVSHKSENCSKISYWSAANGGLRDGGLRKSEDI